MNAVSLILMNFRRKRIRKILTVCSFAVALFLFGILAIIYDAFYLPIEIAGADRLVVQNKISLIMPLPYSYRGKLKQIDGIDLVSYGSWFGGVYQDERNFFVQFAVDTETWNDMFPEFIIPPEQWKAFVEDRQGCIAGQNLVERYGWKIGDRIPLKGTIHQGIWEFNLRGVFQGKRASDDTSQFWFQYKYLDEKSDLMRGYVGWYYVHVSDPGRAEAISDEIDDMFANSPYETVTETEKAWTAAFIRQFGNIKVLLMSVGGVVFFTLLLITGSNMAMSIRERTGEIGIMKTLGFGGKRILFMVLAESLIIALAGGGIGLFMAKLFAMQGDPTGGFLPVFYLSSRNILLGLSISVLIGLAAGIIPAVQSMRLRIVDALRRV
ncbi:MAG: FtsX-like permease family protein [Deltaproteobacteria bacterium]|nr:FtsX-like permease family protein [Deltaproteobacteria bacterium]